MKRGGRHASKPFIMRCAIESHPWRRNVPVVPFSLNRMTISEGAVGIAIKGFFSIPASPNSIGMQDQGSQSGIQVFSVVPRLRGNDEEGPDDEETGF